MEKSKVIEELFTHIVTYSYLILPAIYLLYRSKKVEAKIIGIYGVVFFLMLIAFWEVNPKYIKVYNSIFTFLEYSFFSFLFYLNLTKQSNKRLIVTLSIVFCAFLISNHLFIENRRIDSIAIGFESILIFIYIFLFFLESLNNQREGFIYEHHCFWISAGLLIYLGGSFFINILANVLSAEEFGKYWYFTFIADTIKTIFFAIALIILSRKKYPIKSNSGSVPFLDVI